MSPRTVTIIFMIVVALLVLVYDLFAYHKWGDDATISAVIRSLNERWPAVGYMIIFFFGALIGHWFWK